MPCLIYSSEEVPPPSPKNHTFMVRVEKKNRMLSKATKVKAEGWIFLDK